MATNLPTTTHICGSEYGWIAASSDSDPSGNITLDSARAAIADYDASKNELPAHDSSKVRLVKGPIVDVRSPRYPVGWYINIEDK